MTPIRFARWTIRRDAPLAVCLLTAGLLCLLGNTAAWSQSATLEGCMSAEPAAAETVCGVLLEQGRNDADIYWKLASAYFQTGKRDASLATLDKALSIHPGNAKLSTLQRIITSQSREDVLLTQSRQRSQSSLDKGEAKITCLVKTGRVAIDACRDYLDMTDEDGDRIRQRLASLGARETPTTTPSPPVEPVATVPAPVPRHDTPVATLPSPTAAPPASPPVDNTVIARENAYREIVRETQSLLNGLGFDAGTPDGIPGDRTRSALTDFYREARDEPSPGLGEDTLAVLRQAEKNLKVAKVLLAQSQSALSQGDLAGARARLATAERSSRLLIVPASLRARLAEDDRPATPVPPVTPPPTTTVATSPAPTTTPTSTPTSTPTLSTTAPTTVPPTTPSAPTVTQPETPVRVATDTTGSSIADILGMIDTVQQRIDVRRAAVDRRYEELRRAF